MKSIGFALLLITALSGFTSKRFCGAESPLRLSHHKSIAIMPVQIHKRHERISNSLDSQLLVNNRIAYQEAYYKALQTLKYPIDSSRHQFLPPQNSNQLLFKSANFDSLQSNPKAVGKALKAQALMYTNIREGRHDILNVIKFFANVFLYLSGDWWVVRDQSLDHEKRFKIKVISKFVDVKTGKTLYKVKSKRYCRGIRNFDFEALSIMKQQAQYTPYIHYRVIGAGVIN